ncbi:hypothetical protein MPL3365_140190 [Mesorhizobium plurifarium]|uniref:Uncharacterized protein n=1 Tax=Mesorhizobium plurifarium TaxID=69974 RepID=A0A090GT41_MESPL|nr:hypothetical protein MPL3365_140190 [Mesorhizobium plurifarium]
MASKRTRRPARMGEPPTWLALEHFEMMWRHFLPGAGQLFLILRSSRPTDLSLDRRRQSQKCVPGQSGRPARGEQNGQQRRKDRPRVS